MTREQAINSMISHGFTVEQVGEIIKAVTPQFSSGLDKNSKKLEKPQTFKWCTDCKEYDQEKHCCHRWSKVIRNTVEEMKQPCEDAISREDALMCMTREYIADVTYKPEDIISKHIRRLRALPSVQPKPIECEDAISMMDLLNNFTNPKV